MNDDELVKRIRQGLEADLAEIDPLTRARLAAARERALAEYAPVATGMSWHEWLVSAAGLAAVLALTVVLFGLQPAPVHPPGPDSDFELLASPVRFEFFEELDFYMWLQEQDLNG